MAIPHRARRSGFAFLLLLVLLGAAGSGPLAAQAAAPPRPVPRVTTIGTPEPLPSRGRLGGVAVDRSGNLYVSNFGASVWRLTPDGRLDLLSASLRGSSGNAVDSHGNLLQASFVDGRIVRIEPDGTMSDVVPAGLRGPVGLVAAEDGTIYVCECRGNAVARVTPDGAVSEHARSPDLDCPNGITLGPDGALYVVSFNNGHVVRVDRSGRAVRLATVPGGRNAHIVWARGSLWVTKIEANRLWRLHPDGRAEPYAGTGELGSEDGPAASSPLARPNGVAVLPGGEALVVDTLEGPWRSDEETRIVLRRIDLPTQEERDGVPGSAEEIERTTISVGDLVFDALAAGPIDGELVLLLHGFPQTGDAFRSQLPVLAKAGYRAVAPDQRGYSPGARPQEVGEYVMANFVADVVGMADALGRERFHLVGHDWGGAVAWVTATRFVQRVLTLTVLSTPHFAALSTARSEPDSDQSDRSSYFAEFGTPGAELRLLADDRALLRRILAGLPEEKQEIYVRRLGDPEALRAALAWYHVFARSAPPPPSSAAAGGPARPVAKVRVPTLYLWGSADSAFGREAAERTADFVEGPYDFRVLEGAGHWLPELAADEVNRLLLDHLQAGAQTGVVNDG